MLKRIVLYCLLLCCIAGYSQTKRIKILQSDNTMVDPKYPGAIISLGNVFIEHEGATLRCDKAYIYQDENLMKALGNVVMNQGDTVFQYSKYADYDGNTKMATSWGDVLLKDELMELRTDTLYFDRTKQHLFYRNSGTIKDTTNVLKSRIGNYYLRTNTFQAFNKVVVTNDDSVLVSEHLDYNTETGIADLYGPSTITSEENTIYTERGKHNSKTNISHFLKNSKIYYGERTIAGDSLYYNKGIEFASATGNIKVVDTVQNSVIRGGYAEFHKAKDSVFIVDRAVAVSLAQNDSIYIHGDTLMVTGQVEDRLIRAFRHVKIFKTDLQGKCDSLVSYEKIGLTKFLTNPVLWAQGNQITGDTIHLISNPETEQLDSLKIWNNALMVQKDSVGYSQLKGKTMHGKFEENDLRSLNVVGNSEMVYIGRDEQNKLLGISKMQSSKNILIKLADKQIIKVYFVEMADGKTYPPSEFAKLPEEQQLLPGFIWRENERPLKQSDIFIHDDGEAILNEELIDSGNEKEYIEN